jgi:hypothetical protein
VFVHISPGVFVHKKKKTGFEIFVWNVLLGLEIDEPSGTRPFQSTDKSFWVSGFGWSPSIVGGREISITPPIHIKHVFILKKG